MQLQDYIFYYHSNYLKKLQRNYARATRAQCTSLVKEATSIPTPPAAPSPTEERSMSPAEQVAREGAVASSSEGGMAAGNCAQTRLRQAATARGTRPQ